MKDYDKFAVNSIIKHMGFKITSASNLIFILLKKTFAL